MKKIILTAILLIATFTIQAQKIQWLSFEKAIELNEKNPKPILIDIYTDWCGWCKKLDKNTYANKVIAKYINTHFYAVKLDGEGKKDITYKGHTFKFQQKGRSKYHEFAATLMEGKLSYPTTIFMTKEQKVLQNIPGYLSKERMEKILAFFTNDTYKTTDWTKFEKEFKSNL